MPTPRPASFQPDIVMPPNSRCVSYGADSSFSISQFDYSNPSYGAESEYNSYDANYRVEMTHVQERDLLELPSRSHGRSRSTSPVDFSSRAPPTMAIELTSNAPRWPGVVRLVLRMLIMLSSAAIVGLLAHSLSIYYKTRNMNFSGNEPAWPKSLYLLPSNLLAGVAVASLNCSIVILIQSLRQKFSAPITTGDKSAVAFAIFFIAAWTVAAVVFKRFQEPDKANMAWHACLRKGGATAKLANFDMVCQEQVSRS